MPSKRRRSRIAAMEILYRSELTGDRTEDLIGEVSKRYSLTDESLVYLLRLIDCVEKNRKLIDRLIKRNLKNWTLKRLHLLEKAIMRIATGELLFFPDIPPKVSINEAIEISKDYVDDAGRRFINGVLNGVYKEIEKKKKRATDSPG